MLSRALVVFATTVMPRLMIESQTAARKTRQMLNPKPLSKKNFSIIPAPTLKPCNWMALDNWSGGAKDTNFSFGGNKDFTATLKEFEIGFGLGLLREAKDALLVFCFC